MSSPYLNVTTGEICVRTETLFLCAHPPICMAVLDANRFRRACQAEYESVERLDNGGYVCLGHVTSPSGTVFAVQDQLSFNGPERLLTVERAVEVERRSGEDIGFSSQLIFCLKTGETLQDCDVFMPGAWYGHNEGVCKGAFGASLTDREYLLRATRLALPYVQLHGRSTGESVSLCALAPSPTTGVDEHSSYTLVDSSLQYASVGIHAGSAPGVQICFPGSEGETTYADGLTSTRGWAWRYHPIAAPVAHRYTVGVHIGERHENAHESMRDEWRWWFGRFNPPVHRAALARVYAIGAQVLDTYCQRYNGVMGLPFWCTVPEGTVSDLSFQMGFVGQQPMCAYHLMRYGIQNHLPAMVEKGRKIINFWVGESKKEGQKLPYVWYNVFPPRFKTDYPTYTRTVSDGMEGILLCYQYLKRELGNAPEQWLEFVLAYGQWLVSSQNADGSYFRAYDVYGVPVHTGKFNTSNVIRLLVALFWETGEPALRQAALRAGEYCYQSIYLPLSYIGGTADNDNTIDKEAGMLALYAFLALYDLDGQARWLHAACGAADFIETWTYSYSFEVLPAKGNAVFDRADITGLSLIATGHSHADGMMGYCPFDFYRLFLLTSDKHYLVFARFLLHNTKQTVDWSGKLGHAYPGLVEESGEVARQFHNGLGKWLPWCTIAQIEALSRLEEWFGCSDIDLIETDHAAALKNNHPQGSPFIRLSRKEATHTG